MQDIRETIRYFFDSETLNPHGICLMWRPELLWTHVVSDVVIGVSYFSIPLALGVFLYHRRDVRFGWVIWMFVAFIMLCGVTHFTMVWTLWNPDYGVEALIKAATASASVLTAVAMWPLLPKVIALPSPAALQARIDERDHAVADLRRAMADMVEMKEHEKRQKFLLDELNHRVKNTLVSVQSIAGQTMKNATSIEDFRNDFAPRLMALSATHNLLAERTWEGASFRGLVEATLGHYAKPYNFEGPDLTLNPNLAVTLGMGLHELATNALKYGAWAGAGTVSIEVAAEAGDAVRIVWKERGGPPVRSPEKKGFGSRLLERGVASELLGSVDFDYGPDGFVCTIRALASERIRLAEPRAETSAGA